MSFSPAKNVAMHDHRERLVALVGQPNCGKSTVFGKLTGTHQRIGNYAGVTVEKHSKIYRDGVGQDARQIELVDLPGIYSLTSYSPEERITRNFILLEQPELLVVVVDATELQRHLLLVLQLLEMQIPLVVCLNKIDMLRRRHLSIDVSALEIMLKVPVVAVAGKRGEGIEKLRQVIRETTDAHHHQPNSWRLDYGAELEAILSPLELMLAAREHLMEDFSSRWLAVKLLEDDRDARRIIQHHTHDENWQPILQHAQAVRETFAQESQTFPAATIAAQRTAWAARISQHCTHRSKESIRRSDKIDAIVCHPLWGMLTAILALVVTFRLAFAVATEWTWIYAFHEWHTPIEATTFFFQDWLPAQCDFWMPLGDSPMRSLLHDAIFPGVGGVIQFMPIIFFIFLGVAFWEQSGYAARLVVIMDKLLRRFGLHGASMLPLILGGGIAGGCAVPAVIATRTMKEPKERLLTILVIPLMNCGAKLPVYALLIAAFFSAYHGIVLTALVVISWVVAMLMAWVLSKTSVAGESTPLVIELPPYQIPRLRDCVRTAAQQSWWFVQKAGTVILAASIILWTLISFPMREIVLPENTIAAENSIATNKSEVTWSRQAKLDESYAAILGKTLEPISLWSGFDWRDNVAFIGGIAAKEVIVSTLAVLYEENVTSDFADAPRAELAHQIRSEKTVWSGMAMLLFVMFYAPCTATCAVIWRETQSLYWMLFAIIYTTTLGFTLAVAIFQIGMLL